MPKINTPVVDFHTKDDTNDLFIPCTGAIATAEFQYVNFAVWLAAIFSSSVVRLKPAVQMSDDGINWGSSFTTFDLDVSTPYATAAGWTFSTTSYNDVYAAVTPKLFARFGFAARNASGVTGCITGQAGLLLDFQPVTSPRTWTFGPKRVFCKPSTTAVVHDISGPIPAVNISALRATLEVLACSGSTMDIEVGIQAANKPNDPSDWSQFAAINLSAVSSNGITFPTTFSSVSLTKPWIRIVVRCTGQVGNTTLQAAVVNVRIDAR